jgi:hypothetical protein
MVIREVNREGGILAEYPSLMAGNRPTESDRALTNDHHPKVDSGIQPKAKSQFHLR